MSEINGPFANAWETIKHLFADSCVLLAFLTIIFGFEMLINLWWPNHTDPALFGLHLHDAMVVIKWITTIVWMALSAFKLLRRAWED